MIDRPVPPGGTVDGSCDTAVHYTNVFAIARMAEHVRGVIRDVSTGVDPSEVVERIAALPRTAEHKRYRRHYSFASKFAHFFIDAQRFPIYDHYAVAMVRRHLGRGGLVGDSDHAYKSFVANFGKLHTLTGFELTIRELDRYLWLAGQYREWTRRPTTAINSELRRLFESPLPAALADLRTLVGS